MSNVGMMAAVAAAAGLTETSDIKIDAAFIATNFPDVAASLKADGAKAERERMAAIDLAALPGHEDLVAAYKADSTKSAGDLALAIIDAEKKKRASMLASLDADETKMKGLKTEPANGTEPEKPAAPALVSEAAWKADYAASADLQAEFADESTYLAFMRADARGGIRVLAPRSA